MDVARAHVHPDKGLETVFFVSSRRSDIFALKRLQLSHTEPVPEPADVMQVPPSGPPSAPTGVRGMRPDVVVAG